MYRIDPIEESHLRTAHNTLAQLKQFFDQGTPIYPGALLFDDSDPVEVHVEDSVEHLAEIIKKIEAEKFQGSGS